MDPVRISRKAMTALLIASLSFLVLDVEDGHTQNLDAPYVTTPHEVVAAMLDVADIGPGDYVIDLGSGDGRIVIAAAARGAFGHGMDLDPARIREAEINAKKAGVSDKVQFFQGDLFEADIRQATVVTMYLLDTVNLRLRGMLFEQLRPGTRVVSYTFDMAEWEADAHIVVNDRHVYYWVMPGNFNGLWEWDANGEMHRMEVHQSFQKVTIALSAANRHLHVRNPVVRGERVGFQAVDPVNGNRYAFNGRVDGNILSGTIQFRSDATHAVSNWHATLLGSATNPAQREIHGPPQLPPAQWPW